MATRDLLVGSLRHRAGLYRRVETRSASDGEVIESYSLIGYTRARLEPLNGREFFQAGAGQAELTARVVLRYRTDIDDKDRILIDGKTYAVSAPPINVDGRGRVLHLMVTLVTDGVANG